jgi:hypothetical protein
MKLVYDDSGERVTKAEITRWVRRIREDLRDLEAAMRVGEWESARDAAEDVDPAGGELRYRVQLLFDASRATPDTRCQCPPARPGAVSFGCRCDATPEESAAFQAEWSRWVD